jgi:hypothetical protein
MEIHFPDDNEKIFMARLDSVKNVLAARGSASVDNYTVLSVLLDNFEKTSQQGGEEIVK